MKTYFNPIRQIINLFYPSKLVLVFVGDLVYDVLEKNYKRWSKHCRFIYITTDKNSLKLCPHSKSIHKIYIGDYEAYSCGKRRYEDGFHYAFMNNKRIVDEIKKRKPVKVMFIAKMGYSSSAGITAFMYNELLELGIPTKAYVFRPMPFEGMLAMENFTKAQLFMRKYPHHIYVDNYSAFGQGVLITDYLSRTLVPFIDIQIKKMKK